MARWVIVVGDEVSGFMPRRDGDVQWRVADDTLYERMTAALESAGAHGVAYLVLAVSQGDVVVMRRGEDSRYKHALLRSVQLRGLVMANRQVEGELVTHVLLHNELHQVGEYTYRDWLRAAELEDEDRTNDELRDAWLEGEPPVEWIAERKDR